MKKVLFATTALVASAGFAAADVTLSGSAEMGIIGGDNAPNGEVQFFHDIDVRFTLSGTTDNGLTFGATVDLDEIGDDGGIGIPATPQFGDDVAEHAVFISGDFGTITMGDTDGAFDWALTEVGIGSAIADDHTSHIGYNGNAGLDGSSDGQILRYDNTFGDLGVALSAELDDQVTDTVGTTWGLGATYNFGAVSAVDLGVGIGYQTNDVQDIWGISLNAQFNNGLQAVLNYSDLDGQAAGDNDKHMGIGLGYTVNALTVSANYGEYDLVGGGTNDGWGVAANYDLGGGAVVQFGYGSDLDAATAGSQEQWSLGVAMAF